MDCLQSASPLTFSSLEPRRAPLTFQHLDRNKSQIAASVISGSLGEGKATRRLQLRLMMECQDWGCRALSNLLLCS